MRFLGTGLKTEKKLTMSWKESFNKGTKELFIPVVPVKKGKSRIVITVRNKLMEVEKSIDFIVNNQMVSSNTTQVVSTTIF